MSTPPARPAERYGDIRPAWHSTLARVLTAALAVVGVGWVIYAGVAAANRDVRWKDIGFQIIDSAHAEATFDVTVYEGRTATCTVQALAANYAVIGQVDVQVSVDESRTVRQRAQVLTDQPAVSVRVDSCTVP